MTIAVQPALESAAIPTKQTRTTLYNYPRYGVADIDTWSKVFQEAAWTFYVVCHSLPPPSEVD